MARPMALVSLTACCLVLLMAQGAWSETAPRSPATRTCLSCHSSLHPGLVASWKNSRHARITPAQGLKADELSSRVSSQDIPDELRGVAVGCAECHTANPDSHADTFDHSGFRVHNVVTPDDCAQCHAEEAQQYSQNLMAKARGNLADNPVYQALELTIVGQPRLDQGQVEWQQPSRASREEACFYCHGSKVEVTGMTTRETRLGPMQFPEYKGWPNQGSGRANPDGSLGSCSVCHTRHEFSIETARKPATCKECHIGPDVPASKVYEASKHGAIYASRGQDWNYTAVPWTIGQDFTAPTCAACHMSLTVDGQGQVVAERTHRLNDRLPWRIFGLIYAHPHPKEADTSKIVNAQGLNLPTTLDGQFAEDFLIDQQERNKREQAMRTVCRGCHAESWVKGHFQRFHQTIEASNQAVKTGTTIMQTIWDKGLAAGLGQDGNPFDEAIERRWSRMWLINANKVRFASAMAGGGDYGVFAGGRFDLSERIAELQDWLEDRQE